ncbi:MAG: restriction endonuclease, partial [Chloroflexota bacterium]
MTKGPVDTPLAVWVDNEDWLTPFMYFFTEEVVKTVGQSVEFVHVRDTDDAVDLILRNRKRVFAVVQDSYRRQGAIIPSWKRLRSFDAPSVGHEGLCGDFVIYVMDAYAPLAANVFAGAFYSDAERAILEQWSSMDPRIFSCQKPFGLDDMARVLSTQFNRWMSAKSGNALSPQTRLLEGVGEELAVLCGARPSYVEHLTARQFEEVIAAVLKNQGFQVELTARTRDGGYDILAVSG